MAVQTQEILFNGIELGIGTWSWGDKLIWHYGHEFDNNDVFEMFKLATENGIRFFDTAEIYGQGKSESFLGELMKAFPEPVSVATKFMPYPWRMRSDALDRSLNASLHRLGRNSVELYQIHMPLPFIPIHTWMEKMAEAQETGKVKSIGVSNYNLDQTMEAQKVLTNLGTHLVSNQVEYNLLERRIEKNGLFSYCKEKGIKVIAYSPLAMGVLSGKYTPENPPKGVRASQYNRNFLAKIQPLIKLMKKIGLDHDGKTASQVAINWVVCKEALPIPGAKNSVQLEQNIGSIGWRLTEDEVKILDEISDRVNVKD